VPEIGVGEDDLVDVVRADELRQLVLRTDRDPLGIPRPGERRRVGPLVDPRDLRRGERDDLRVGVVAERDVEVVEVASAGSHDDDLAHLVPPFGALSCPSLAHFIQAAIQ
jgi:hypothetical protein